MAIEAFSNFNVIISDGGTVPSINYLAGKAYIDIGSGNILKISWDMPSAINNMVDSYKIYVQYYDVATDSYKYLCSVNIGNINEYYLRAGLLNSIPQSLIKLRIFVEAISKHGSTYNGISNTISTYVGKGCGIYKQVAEGYTQPIFKRSVAMAKLGHPALLDSAARAIISDDNKIMHIATAATQDISSGWTLMQECYSKGTDGSWKLSDVAYEVLTDSAGDVVTDLNNSAVYIL